MGPTVAEELRREHFGTLREAIAASDGSEVKNTGDGLMAAFPSASGAVECAVAMQQRMERRNRGATEQLTVRIGISMGDATHEGGDYFGMPSIEAARLCNAADGGQILAPELVRLMVGRRDGFDFRTIGALDLKGLPEPVAAFEVAWEPLDKAPGAQPLPSALLGVPPAAFVGRVEERDGLRRSWEEASGGRRRAVLIAGEPGIGKTRIATYCALEAHGEGATVLWGHCTEDMGAPYSAWIGALSHYVEHAPEDVLRAHAEHHGGELCRLVPALARRLPDLAPPRETDPETERYLLFAAVAALLESAAEHAPVVVVLDDLHWADRQTLSLLRQLMAGTAPARLLLLGTFRESDLRRSHPLTDVLADLRRAEGVERLALKGLGEPDVVAIMESAAGHEMDPTGLALARQIASETDGNPFFVAEILRHLTESGALAQRADGRWQLERGLGDLGLPQSVREVVGRRVEQLGPGLERVLTAAAVIGREFEVDLLVRVAETAEDELLDALDTAVEALILTESSAGPGRFSFAHALINHTLYDALGATRRARLHRRVAEALEDMCGEDPGARLPELAHHWSAATAAVDPTKALGYARQAGERALKELAPDEAMRWFGHALELHEQLEQRDAGQRCELLIGLGEAQRQAGDADFRETLLEASGLARKLRDGDRLVSAVLANSRGFQSTTGLVDDERVEFVEAALELLDAEDVPHRAALLALLAQELLWGGDFTRRKQLSDEALDLARRSGDERTLAFVLWRRYTTISVPETLPERLENMAELGELAERLGDTELSFWAIYHQTCGAQEAGDLARIDEGLSKQEKIVREVGQPVMEWLFTCGLHVRALLAGSVSEAEALAEQAAQVGSDSGQSDALVYYLSQLHAIRWAAGGMEEHVELAASMMEDNPGIPGLRSLLAGALSELDRLDDAREVLAPASAAGFEDLPRDMLWLAALCMYGQVSAHIGDRAAAAVLYERLAGCGDQMASIMITTYPCVSHTLGLLAATLGRLDDADAHFADAARIHEGLGARAFLARTRLEWARAKLERGEAEEARSLLDLARTAARELGCETIERRATELASSFATAS